MLIFSKDSAAEDTQDRKVFTSSEEQVSLLELYSSEGCSSCPPAEKVLYDMRGEPGLWRSFVPIGFHVTYWDRLGWIDKLANQNFTERQYAYERELGTGNVYTPEFILNGKELRSVPSFSTNSNLKKSGQLNLILMKNQELSLEFKPVKDFKTNLRGHNLQGQVVTLGNEIESNVKSGENKGVTLRHSFVALNMQTLPLKYIAETQSYAGKIALQTVKNPGTKNLSLAAWVSLKNSIVPIQAVGGDLN